MNVDAARLVKAVVNVNPVSFVSVRRYGFVTLKLSSRLGGNVDIAQPAIIQIVWTI